MTAPGRPGSRITIRLPVEGDDVYRRFKVACLWKEKNVGDAITRAMELWLQRYAPDTSQPHQSK